jgi:hypothetical protein
VKRLLRAAGVAVVALGLSAGTAQAQRGAPDFHIIDNPVFVYANGPGFNVLMTKHGIHTTINDAKFGIPEAGFPIQRATQQIPAAARPIVCEGGTYRTVGSLTFTTVQRASSTTAETPRPAPYTALFNTRFPNIFTFVGTVEGTVVNEAGEQFKLYSTDLAHEVITDRSFASTNPIHAYIVDSRGRVREYASLEGRVNVDLKTGNARHKIIDKGTCHQTANLNLGPGTDAATVFGPLFVLPFNTKVVGHH